MPAVVTSNNDVRDLISYAEDLGFKAERTNGGHIRFLHPLVAKPVFTSSTPSDWRSVENTASQLRRALRQAQSDEVAAAEVRSDDAPVGYACPACMGQRGVSTTFDTPAELIAHVEENHPAAPITDPNHEKEQQMTDAEIVQMEDRSKVEYEELVAWLEDKVEPGATVTREVIMEEFHPRPVANSIEVLRQRGKNGRDHLDRLVSVKYHRGTYTWVPHYLKLSTISKSEVQVQDEEPEVAKSEKVKESASDAGKIFEVVNQFVDGRFLVRDEEGNLFIAGLQAL